MPRYDVGATAAVLLGLAACGGDSSGAASATSAPGSVPPTAATPSPGSTTQGASAHGAPFPSAQDPLAVPVDITLSGEVSAHLSAAEVTCQALVPRAGVPEEGVTIQPGPDPGYIVQFVARATGVEQSLTGSGDDGPFLLRFAAPGVAPAVLRITSGRVRYDPGARAGSFSLSFGTRQSATDAQGSFQCPR